MNDVSHVSVSHPNVIHITVKHITHMTYIIHILWIISLTVICITSKVVWRKKKGTAKWALMTWNASYLTWMWLLYQWKRLESESITHVVLRNNVLCFSVVYVLWITWLTYMSNVIAQSMKTCRDWTYHTCSIAQ